MILPSTKSEMMHSSGSLVSVLGVQLLEALHDSPGVQKHSPQLLQAVGEALQAARQRTSPPRQFQNNRVPIGSLTLLEFTSDGLPKRTPVISFSLALAFSHKAAGLRIALRETIRYMFPLGGGGV